MGITHSDGERLRFPVLWYLLAAALIVVATALRVALDSSLGDSQFFGLSFFAVMFVLWRDWGRGPTLFALLFGGACGVYFFLIPRGAFRGEHPEWIVGLVTYLIAGTVTIALVESLRTVRRSNLMAARELRESSERQTFLLAFSDALRPLGDAKTIQSKACELLGECLGVDRVGYVESEPGEQVMVVAQCWTSAGTPPVIGRFRIDEFGTFFTTPLREGRAATIEDASTDPRVSSEMYANTWATIGVRAAVAYPLVKRGRLVAALFVNQSGPRQWTQGEITLMGEVGERTWAAVERAAAETALHAAHDTFRHLVEHSPFGVYAVDADFRLVQVSAGAQKVFANVRPLLGRDFSDVIRFLWPEPFATEAIDRFRHTLATGEPHRAARTIEQRRDIDEVEAYDWKIERVTLPDGRHGVVCHFYDLSERLRYETTLRTSETRLRQATEAAGMFAWDVDLAPGTMTWSANAAALIGCRPEDLPTAQAEGTFFVDPTDATRMKQEFASRVQSGDDDFDTEFRDRNGVRWWHVHGRVLRDAAGVPQRTVGVTQDVTARKLAEEAVRKRDEQLRLVTDSAPVLIAHCDTEARYKFVNRPYAERFGLTPKDVIGKRIPDVLGEAAFDQFRHYLDEVLTGKAVEFEAEIPYQLGGTHVMRCAYTPERDDAGRVVGLIAALINITDRKRMEDALRASERQEADRAEELRAVLHATPTPIWIAHDAQCRVITGNPASYRLFGVPDGANVSASSGGPLVRPYQEYRRGMAVSASDLPMQRAAATGVEVAGVELSLVFEDGHVRHVLGNAAPLRSPDGTVRGAVAGFVDVTDLKRVEEELREADHRKNEFLAMLGHELRNPLASIANLVQMLGVTDSKAPLPETRAKIEQQLEHVSRLVDDLLDVSRVSRGKVKLVQEPLDLVDAVQHAAETTRPLLDARRHTLTLTLPEQPVRVLGDFTRLAQVVANLLNNAAKYTDLGGRIGLTVEASGDVATIRVQDSGCGFDPAVTGNLFDLFYQVDVTHDRSEGGLGIGLSLVKTLVELHGGTVTAHSAGRGRGSEFTVRIPYHAAEPPAEPVERPTTVRTGTLRVLVVDDNEDAAESLAMLLELDGHNVLVAHDGKAAVEIGLRERPDVVLMDIGLPGLNGYQACRALRDGGLTGSLVVAMTGYGLDDDRRQSAEAGFNSHQVKPVKLQTVRDLLATR